MVAEITATVAEVRPEAPRAVTIRMDLAGAEFSYRPGQYIEIDPHQFEALAPEIRELEARKSMPEMPRSFSLSSDGGDRRFIEISVKITPQDGPYSVLLTPHLTAETKPGDRITFRGPHGRYCLSEACPEGITGILHLCAGSGVAPNRGMIRSALFRGWTAHHLLLLQNSTEEDVFYKSEWPEVAARFPDRFRIRHVFSKGPRREHVSVEMVREAMSGYLDGAASLALVCGPNRPRQGVAPDGSKVRQPGFVDAWCGVPRRNVPGRLQQLGFGPERILTEMW
ncbi:MAG: hypothetical protein HY716_12660 [Planctomycetes bacterium]|nr:hypothetical protein [Planctomycetota bacterium]